MQRHQWHEDEGEGRVYYRATYHAGEWRLSSQPDGEEVWTEHDPIPVELLQRLREVVWNKYQRKRCPYKLVEKIDKMLGKDD